MKSIQGITATVVFGDHLSVPHYLTKAGGQLMSQSVGWVQVKECEGCACSLEGAPETHPAA